MQLFIHYFSLYHMIYRKELRSNYEINQYCIKEFRQQEENKEG